MIWDGLHDEFIEQFLGFCPLFNERAAAKEFNASETFARGDPFCFEAQYQRTLIKKPEYKTLAQTSWVETRGIEPLTS